MPLKKRNPDITHKIMSAIRSKDTKPELKLRKKLWARGLRYRKHYKIIGSPDLVFISKKIAIFVDGDYWHGNNWKIRGMSSLEEELENYSEYWKNKITKNIQRDSRVNIELKKKGWLVLRFWESDIKKNIDSIVQEIEEKYKQR